ncbi:MFS transporter [Streptomyces sp. NPDC059788]|uniref:MFS transporter n=1 Tax=Streptomyces sp. NPDC059788 TaxID=3346948 RepID=UPI003666FCD2
MATDTQTTPTAPGIWATFRDSPLAVKTILAGVLASRLGGFLNIFLVLYLTDRGYSAEEAAFALGVYGIGGVAGVFLGGTLAERLGARNATVLGMAATAALTAALLYLPDYGLLLAAIALVSMAAQLYRPASTTLLSDLTSRDGQVMIFAMYRFSLNLGTTVAPLLGFALYNLDDSYVLLFWGEGIVALGYAVLARATIPARPRPTAAGETGADAAGQAPADGYRVLLRDRRYLLFLLAAMVNAMVYVQYLSTLPLDVKASGMPILWYTVAVSANGFIVIAFELGLTKLSQKWPMKITIAVAWTLIGLGVALYSLPLGAAVVIGATLVWTLGEIVGGPSVFAYPALAGPAPLRGRYISAFQFAYALGMAVGPALGGVLFTRLQHGVWAVFGALGLFAAVLGVAAVRVPVAAPATAGPEADTAEPQDAGTGSPRT